MALEFFYAKMLFEISFVVLGWIIGGPVGIGTIAFVCIVGPCIIPFMMINKRILGLTNYGLDNPAF
jgi:uncharacterized protein